MKCLRYVKKNPKQKKGKSAEDAPEKRFSRYKELAAATAMGAVMLLSSCVFDTSGARGLVTNSNRDASLQDVVTVDVNNHNSNDGSIDVNDPKDAEPDVQNQHDAAVDANHPDSSVDSTVEDAEVVDAEPDAEIVDAEVDGGLLCEAVEDNTTVDIPLYSSATVGEMDHYYAELVSAIPLKVKMDIVCSSNSLVLRQDIPLDQFQWYGEDIPEAGVHIGILVNGLNINEDLNVTIIVTSLPP